MDGMAGVMAMETNCAGETVRVVNPVMAPEVAEMVVAPVFTLAARPAEEMVATEVAEERQVAVEVRSWVLPSL